MKKLVTALALSAFAATPAFAATHHRAHAAPDAYAAADPNVVFVDGIVVGADPDPNIRLSLIRDSGLLAD
jgi:hypothetical protein